MTKKTYDVVVIGGGASGTALYYTLSRYTNIASIALIEKYPAFAKVNSGANNNSQTLHIGDIETNYSLEKAKSVKPAANMVPRYVEHLTQGREGIVFTMPKMVLAVGEKEVAELTKRYEDIKDLYPDIRKIGRDEIANVEPNIVKGRDPQEQIIALYTDSGHAVDFEALSQSFMREAKRTKPDGDVYLGEKVLKFEKTNDGYDIITDKQTMHARAVVVDTDAYSLLFAKSLGYGKEYSLIPVAGNFYFSNELLRGKVYTVQQKKLPFAAVHGDPDVQVKGKTRWGPTAKFFPVMEMGHIGTSVDYFRSAGLLRFATIRSLVKILSDKIIVKFLAKNLLYEIPFIGKRVFLRAVRKIIPSMTAADITRAKGFGGMRLQRVDTRTSEMQLGEGKIIGDRIIFNMTPSPGASVCLFNAMRDSETLMSFFDGQFTFEKERMQKELVD